MKKLFMALGLPGAGKSTWAKSEMAKHPGSYVRVNKDDMRLQLHDGRWSRDNEKFVLFVRDFIIVEALRAGKHVIVDDTNLAPKHEERLRYLAGQNGAHLEVVDFRDVPIEVCIERDLKRLVSVGEKVIREMHAQFLAPTNAVYSEDPSLPTCVICDIDGTVALMNGRGPYEEEKVDTDLPNEPVVHLIKNLLANGERIIFVSGRHEAVRAKTEEWLYRNVMQSKVTLFMRPNGDSRKDYIVKAEIFEREFRGKYRVRFVLDDRSRVVTECWRRLGIPCFQVAEGNF